MSQALRWSWGRLALIERERLLCEWAASSAGLPGYALACPACGNLYTDPKRHVMPELACPNVERRASRVSPGAARVLPGDPR